MSENTAPRRPKKAAFAVMCVLLAILLVVNVVAAVLVPPNYDMINSFFYSGPSGEEVDAAKKNSADMTRRIEEEGIILLENKGNALPLQSGIPVNLFGYGSRDTVYGGSGSGAGDSTNNVTIAKGLENAGFQVNADLVKFYDERFVPRTGVGFTGNNFDINEPPVSEYSDALIQGAKDFSDVAIFVISRLGGEGADLPMDMGGTVSALGGEQSSAAVKGGDPGKHYLELQQTEIDVLEMVKKNFDTVIVLVNSTNAMELGWLEDEAIDAALWVGCLGSTGADAVGEVLAGKVNPSGRTTGTFAYNLESAPTYYSIGAYNYTNVEYVNTNPIATSHDPDAYHYVDYLEGIYVGYRYYETAAADGFIDYDETVQYPFGYGLSYTSFTQEITDFQNNDSVITMEVKITNTGDVAGRDVAQVYVSAPYTPGGIEKSHVVLADFTKTNVIEAGQSETITLTFPLDSVASFDYTGVKADGGAYVLEAGDYQINLQNNSHDVIDSRTITISGDRIYDSANNGARENDLIAAVSLFDDVSFGECQTYVSRADWAGTMPTQRVPETREATDSTVAALNNKDVPNNDSDTPIVFADHGLKLEDMAGLEYDDPKWEQLLEQVTMNEMVNLVANGGWTTQAVPSVGKLNYVEVDGPNGINNIMAGSTGNQYCGQSVLGCTWNSQLANEMGKVFGQEAIAMDIAALYAPGLNIHRSPFSGRNYEYFSEDGYHTGKMAAAEIQGIQSQGITTYAKHFAVNDQETNRNMGGLLTWVNEQAMREVYLKGFELAVKDGGSRGIMSSFNRLGTTNTSESYELLTTILRNEWGFRGTVITDANMQHSYMNVDRCLRAGNDLILALMNFQAPSEATTGTATGQQALRQATHNILYSAANSVGQEVSGVPVPYWLYIGVGVIDAVLLGLCAFYFILRHKNMQAWKAAQK